jgi:tetratricopeptide (TPR) repeat protein
MASPRTKLLILSVWILPLRSQAFGPNRVESKASMESVQFAEALQALTAGDAIHSQKLLKKLTLSSPKKALYWFNLGNSYFLLGSYAKAIQTYEKVSALKSPLDLPARFYIAKCYRKLQQKTLARQLLASLQTKELPPNLKNEIAEEARSLEEIPEATPGDALLQQGLDAYEAKDYEHAKSYFDHYLKKYPTSKGYMMRGLTLLRENLPVLAREDFAKVLETNDETLRQEAQDFLSQIESQTYEAQVPYWLSVSDAVAANSNLYDNGASEGTTSAYGSQLTVSGDARVFKNDQSSIHFNYQFYEEDFLSEASARFQVHSLQSIFTSHYQDWLLQPVLGLQLQDLSSSPFLFKQTAGLRVQKSWQGFDGGVSLKVSQTDSRTETYRYLAGPSRSGRLYGNYSTSRYFFIVFLALSTEASGDLAFASGAVLPLANESQSVGFSATYYPSEIWEFSNLLMWSNLVYKNPSQPDGTSRSDQQFENSTKVSYTWSPKVQIFFREDVVLNKSSLSAASVADKNYSKYLTLLGITWEALP